MAGAKGRSREQFRRLTVLIAVNCVDMIGFAIVLPLLPFYALRFGASAQMVGALIASFSVAQLLAAPLWGRVSDRIGRRFVLLIGLSASAMAYVLFGFADSLLVLFLSRIIQGAGGGTTGVTHAYVADTISPGDRARALGWLSAASSAGIAIGPVIGSLAAHLGPEAPGLVAAALCVVNIFFAWRWLPESKPDHEGPPERKPIWHTGWQVVRNPRAPVSRLIWIYAVGMLAFTCMTSVLALYLHAEFAITAETIGYFFLYIGGLSFFMRSLVLGPVVERIGETWAVRAGALLLVVGLVAYAMAPTLWALLVVIPLVPIGTALLFPSTTSLISQVADRKIIGTLMGTAQSFAGISRVVAPLLATRAFQDLGHGSPFYIAGGIVALASLLSFGIRHEAALEGLEVGRPGGLEV